MERAPCRRAGTGRGLGRGLEEGASPRGVSGNRELNGGAGIRTRTGGALELGEKWGRGVPVWGFLWSVGL